MCTTQPLRKRVYPRHNMIYSIIISRYQQNAHQKNITRNRYSETFLRTITFLLQSLGTTLLTAYYFGTLKSNIRNKNTPLDEKWIDIYMHNACVLFFKMLYFHQAWSLPIILPQNLKLDYEIPVIWSIRLPISTWTIVKVHKLCMLCIFQSIIIIITIVWIKSFSTCIYVTFFPQYGLFLYREGVDILLNI